MLVTGKLQDIWIAFWNTINIWCVLPPHHPSRCCQSITRIKSPAEDEFWPRHPVTKRHRFSGLFTLGDSNLHSFWYFGFPEKLPQEFVCWWKYGYKFIQEFMMETWIQMFLLALFVAFQRFGGTLILFFPHSISCFGKALEEPKNICNGYTNDIRWYTMISVYIYIYLCDSERSSFVVLNGVAEYEPWLPIKEAYKCPRMCMYVYAPFQSVYMSANIYVIRT